MAPGRFVSFLACFLGCLLPIGCGKSEASSDETSPSGGTTVRGGTSGDAGSGGTTGSGGTGGDAGSGGTSGSGGAMCREVITDPRPTFDACGGDPTGSWRLTSMDATGMTLTVVTSTGPDGFETAECDTDLASQTERFDYLMNLAEDGAYEDYVGIFQVSLRASNDCFLDAAGVDCDDVAPAGLCSSDSCGVCKCETGIEMPVSAVSTWSVSDGTILLDGSPTYDFCVTGDSMVLQHQRHIRFTFERVHLSGQPDPCATRMENCESGMGCTWSGSACSGTAPAACELADYIDTPGCALTIVP